MTQHTPLLSTSSATIPTQYIAYSTQMPNTSIERLDDVSLDQYLKDGLKAIANSGTSITYMSTIRPRRPLSMQATMWEDSVV